MGTESSVGEPSSGELDFRRLRVLVVDDHDVALAAAERLLGEPDQWPQLATPPKGTNLKWIQDPQVAVDFLSTIDKHGWQPDYVLADFEFLGSAHTGLGIIAAARRHAPEAIVSVFSGHSSNNGRTLFATAAYHWFGVRCDLDKARTKRDLPCSWAPTQPYGHSSTSWCGREPISSTPCSRIHARPGSC